MNLDDIPNGSLCVLDTNVLLYAEQGSSAQAQRLLQRIEKREVVGVATIPSSWLSALRLGADALVSADGRFRAIREIKVYAPSDFKLPATS